VKPELTLLAWSVILAIVHMLVAVQGLVSTKGIMTAVGNRDNLPELPGWAGRAVRANRNMAENLALFAAVVLVAALIGKSNSMTLLGAQLFFWARLAYVGVYIAGIPWLRTGVWTVSVVGLALIFFALL